MNFLAHIYLSGSNDFVKMGNFMADGIRGKEYLNFPEDIKKGIMLHRNIDSFTDAHPVFRISKHRLHDTYGHYSGVIVDVFYDHFLAKNWHFYSDESLAKYVDHFYSLLTNNEAQLTEKTKQLLPYMIKFNWLYSYKTTIGIENILTQMDRRTDNRSKMRFATSDLIKYYADFESEFTAFFDELIIFSKQKLLQL